jgi:hypothetical protein
VLVVLRAESLLLEEAWTDQVDGRHDVADFVEASVWSPPKPSWGIVCPSFGVSEGIGGANASMSPPHAQHSPLGQRHGGLVVVRQSRVGKMSGALYAGLTVGSLVVVIAPQRPHVHAMQSGRASSSLDNHSHAAGHRRSVPPG